jgi:hypothetical protein
MRRHTASKLVARMQEPLETLLPLRQLSAARVIAPEQRDDAVHDQEPVLPQHEELGQVVQQRLLRLHRSASKPGHEQIAHLGVGAPSVRDIFQSSLWV